MVLMTFLRRFRRHFSDVLVIFIDLHEKTIHAFIFSRNFREFYQVCTFCQMSMSRKWNEIWHSLQLSLKEISSFRHVFFAFFTQVSISEFLFALTLLSSIKHSFIHFQIVSFWLIKLWSLKLTSLDSSFNIIVGRIQNVVLVPIFTSIL